MAEPARETIDDRIQPMVATQIEGLAGNAGLVSIEGAAQAKGAKLKEETE